MVAMLKKPLFGIMALTLVMALAPARVVHATAYTVNSTADPGDGICNATNCTLREAITAAMVSAGTDTITFSVDGVILLNSTLPSITSTGGALTIDATGRNIDINGDEKVRLFAVLSGASLTLKNLELEEGYASEALNYGGGIWNAGNLTVTDCGFNHNRAYTSGGAIYNTGYLTSMNTVFYSNEVSFVSGGAIMNAEGATANITGGGFSFNWAELGGAIRNKGTLTVIRSIFWLNRGASTGGGAIATGSQLTVYNSTFDHNTTSQKGGAIYIDESGHAAIGSSSFTYNQASYGGGLYHEGTVMGIYSTEFSHNQAFLDGGGLGGSGDDMIIDMAKFTSNSADRNGGGMYYFGDDRVDITGCTFYDNQADENGGGLYYSGLSGMEITGCTFHENFAVVDGGGIWTDGGAFGLRMVITNSTLSANQAGDQGGGIYSEGYQDLLNCTLSGNQALSGGGIYASEDVQFQTRFKNTIVADSPSGGNCVLGIHYLSCNQGNNLDDGSTCGWDDYDGSMSNTDPMLDSLDWNGGGTQTMRLLDGSPAINGVVYRLRNDCPSTDQRGYLRLLTDNCDIGAFELVFLLFLPITVE